MMYSPVNQVFCLFHFDDVFSCIEPSLLPLSFFYA